MTPRKTWVDKQVSDLVSITHLDTISKGAYDDLLQKLLSRLVQ